MSSLDQSIQTLLQSTDEDERLRGLQLLAQAGADQHLAPLYRAMGDESWRVRKQAVEIFFQVPNATALAAEIIELLHSQDNAGLRNAAVEVLVRFGRMAVPQLLEELGCNDHDVRKFVLDVLGDIGDDRAVPGMLAALRDEDNNVRAAAAENLGKLRAVAAVNDLLQALPDGDLMFKFTVLEALAVMQAKVDTAQLLPFLEDKLLRKALFDCLGRIGDEQAVPVLVTALSDGMRNVAEAACIALERLAGRGIPGVAKALAELAGTPAVGDISSLLASRPREVRAAVVTLLGMIVDNRAVAALLPLLEEPSLAQEAAGALVAVGRKAPEVLRELWPQAEPQQQVYLAYLFGETGCRSCSGELHQALLATDPELRHAAAQSLGRLGDKSALPGLIECLDDEIPNVRDAVVAALSRIGEVEPAGTLAAITPLLEAASREKRSSAVTVLGRLQGRDVERALTFALKDEAADVRRAAVRSLSGRQGEELIEALLLALTDEDAEVRRVATETLGQLGDAALTDPLRLALQDEDIWVRAAAVRSLGSLATGEALRLVESALADPVGLVVITALETLAAQRPDLLSVQLPKALEHADEEVVNSALNLLAGLGSNDWLVSYGEKLLNHTNWEVRLTAGRTLAACLGPKAINLLEDRLLIEGESLVKNELQDLIETLQESLG